jgi:PIN domain nuclease of toxin-antitoxin system
VTTWVFDASALLALLGDEPGAANVVRLMEESKGEAVASTANMAEVISKLIDRGVAEPDALQAWQSLDLRAMPLGETDAAAAAALRQTTRSLGLSLGDRCCLALAQALPEARVVTADRPWKALKGFHFEFIR